MRAPQSRPGTGGDRGRAEVYEAELAAFDGTELELVETFVAIAAFVHRLITGSWWPAGPVAVRPARRDSRTSSTRVGARHVDPVIRLASAQCTRATAVHELAHVLAGPTAGHGALFRRAHIDVATVAFGAERARWLDHAYRSAGLDVAARRWPAPGPADSGPAIAL